MLFGEAHAVVADPQGRFAGLSLELLHIAFAGLSEAVQRGEDAHSGLANRYARQYDNILAKVGLDRSIRRNRLRVFCQTGCNISLPQELHRCHLPVNTLGEVNSRKIPFALRIPRPAAKKRRKLVILPDCNN